MAITTQQTWYAKRLLRASSGWRKWLNVQLPYRWNLRSLNPGYTLDVGCGGGRNLGHLDGRGIGIDPNPDCVAMARQKGFVAFTPEEFLASPQRQNHSFDSLLFAHVLEHVNEATADQLLQTYLPLLKPGGQLVIITPQEKGYASDPTHIRFVDFSTIKELFQRFGLQEMQQYSFPFPRWVGRLFAHNEFVSRGVMK